MKGHNYIGHNYVVMALRSWGWQALSCHSSPRNVADVVTFRFYRHIGCREDIRYTASDNRSVIGTFESKSV